MSKQVNRVSYARKLVFLLESIMKYNSFFNSFTDIILSTIHYNSGHTCIYLGTHITAQELVKEVAIATIYLQFCI